MTQEFVDADSFPSVDTLAITVVTHTTTSRSIVLNLVKSAHLGLLSHLAVRSRMTLGLCSGRGPTSNSGSYRACACRYS